jgi:hypothetical protein
LLRFKEINDLSEFLRLYLNIHTSAVHAQFGMFFALMFIIYLYDIYTPFFRLPDSPDWDGPLQANTKLNLVDRIFENQIKGPESFAVHDGHLYTGLMSGLIVKIDPDDLSITPVARVGTDCEGQHEDVKCGRPLGLEFTQDGDLLVCDAVFGLYLVKFNPQQVKDLEIKNNCWQYL